MVYLDFDGVLCDLQSAFLERLWREYQMALSLEDITEYDMEEAISKRYFGTERYRARKLVADELASLLLDKDDLIYCCKPIRPIWSALIDCKVRGYWNAGPPKVSILTARTGIALEACEEWLALWGLRGMPIISDHRKIDHLMLPEDVLLDDSPGVHQVYVSRPKASEGRLIVVDQPWNQMSSPGVFLNAELRMGPVLAAGWLRDRLVFSLADESNPLVGK